jgi:hypothetical protein
MNRTSDKSRQNCLNRIHFLIPCLLVLAFIVARPAEVFPQELEMINRPVNTAGFTGLLFTTMPFTLPTGSFEVAVIGLSENSNIPNYTITELPVISITAGISDSMELGFQESYYQITEISGNKVRGIGDAELLYKWNFLPQKEDSLVPAVAMIITGVLPTSDNAAVQEVNHWGMRFGLSAGSEIVWGMHVIGIYADAQMAVQDVSDDTSRDSYGITDIGLLFPISKYRNLQMILEYNTVFGKDKITVSGGDYSGITTGLRLVSERFNASIGTQFLHKQISGYENSSRVVGVISLKF